MADQAFIIDSAASVNRPVIIVHSPEVSFHGFAGIAEVLSGTFTVKVRQSAAGQGG